MYIYVYIHILEQMLHHANWGLKEINRIHTCVFIRLCVAAYIFKYLSIWIYMQVYMWHICVLSVCVHRYLYIYLYIFISISIYLFIYLHIYIHIYIHTYIYIYIHIMPKCTTYNKKALPQFQLPHANSQWRQDTSSWTRIWFKSSESGVMSGRSSNCSTSRIEPLSCWSRSSTSLVLPGHPTLWTSWYSNVPDHPFDSQQLEKLPLRTHLILYNHFYKHN